MHLRISLGNQFNLSSTPTRPGRTRRDTAGQCEGRSLLFCVVKVLLKNIADAGEYAKEQGSMKVS